MTMSFSHPLDAIAAVPGVAEAELQASQAIAAVHRRPVSLRRAEVTSSEGLLRGARLSAMLSGAAEEKETSAYSVLAPAEATTTAATFRRAPLQVFARLDTLLGGPGTPVSAAAAARLSTLARLITGPDHPRPGLLPVVVHLEVETHEFFGPRSGSIARVAGRVAAAMTGFDPRVLAVPETYLHRHRPAQLTPELLLAAWEAGAAEAEGIARAASGG